MTRAVPVTNGPAITVVVIIDIVIVGVVRMVLRRPDHDYSQLVADHLTACLPIQSALAIQGEGEARTGMTVPTTLYLCECCYVEFLTKGAVLRFWPGSFWLKTLLKN